jgi:hypothetical protein
MCIRGAALPIKVCGFDTLYGTPYGGGDPGSSPGMTEGERAVVGYGQWLY